MNETYPPAVTLNWNESHRLQRCAEQAEADLPALDKEIAKLQTSLDALRAEYAARGRQSTELREGADHHRELVELWCGKHGRQLPPPPERVAVPESRPRPTPTEPVSAAVAVDDLAPELRDPLVAGPAADLITPDPLGGEAPELSGPFHPGSAGAGDRDA